MKAKEMEEARERAIAEMRNYCEQMAELRKSIPAPKGYAHCCIEEFLLKHGKASCNHVPEKVHGFPAGEPGNCFGNALHLAVEKGLIYVEGLARGVIPTAHAWCVRPGTEEIIDTTWVNLKYAEPRVYFGVAFDLKFALKTVRSRGCYGVIDDWENRWPLFKGGLKGWKYRR